MTGIASAAHRTTASPAAIFQRGGDRRGDLIEVVAPRLLEGLRVTLDDAFARTPDDVVAQPLEVHHAERVERLRDRDERLQVDRRDRDRRALFRRARVVLASRATVSFASISPWGSTADRHRGAAASDRRRHDLLPALQASRVGPVGEAARRPGDHPAGCRRIRSSTPAQLVGHFHELHRVHVAGEHARGAASRQPETPPSTSR